MLEHGKEALSAEMRLGKLGACGADIYAMVCSLARASRAYSEGQFDGELETDLARILCKYDYKKIMEELLFVVDGEKNEHFNMKRITANQLLDSKGYQMSHPLTKMVP